MDNKERITKYIACIYQYGIIPMLRLLEEYENGEMFEECLLITQSIDIINTYDETSEQLPKNYRANVNALKMNYSKFGCQGDISKGRIPYFVEQIKKDVV